MASGLIMVAHKSGGPMMDIIIHSKGSQPIGFLGSDEIEYSDILCQIIRMEPRKRKLIREAARYMKKFFIQNLIHSSLKNVLSFIFVTVSQFYNFKTILSRNSVARFSDDSFEKEFLKVLAPLMECIKKK